MKKPLTPADEVERLVSLKSLSLLDTPAEERFDRITRLAKKSLGTQISLISLIDDKRQWFKSAQGLTASETPRDVSFCGHAILDDETFVVPDARQDPRFADNPLVSGDPNIRLYAGQPLHGPDGQRIGTLCVIDSEPREFGPEESLLLRDLAVLVENEIRVEQLSNSERDLREQLTEAERRASIDGLTRVWNRGSIMKLLNMEAVRSDRAGKNVAAAMIDIDHFKRINDTLGHSAGDAVLSAVAERIRGALRPYDSVGRVGGEEFLVVIGEPDPAVAEEVGERIRKRIAYAPIEHPNGKVDVTASVGVCSRKASDLDRPGTIVDSADQALYAAKNNGRNRVETCRDSAD